MKKNQKTIFLIAVLILVFITIISLVYGFINVRADKSKTIDESTYTDAVQECIDTCKEYSSVLSDSTEYDMAIDKYLSNIDDAKTPALKAYVADNMATFALKYFSEKSVEFEANLTENGAVSPYTKVLENLNTLKTELDGLV